MRHNSEICFKTIVFLPLINRDFFYHSYINTRVDKKFCVRIKKIRSREILHRKKGANIFGAQLKNEAHFVYCGDCQPVDNIAVILVTDVSLSRRFKSTFICYELFL